MSAYLQQEFDFIKRTKKILEQYNSIKLPKKESFEITLLINCFVGLLILPQTKWFDNLPTDLISEKEWGISESHISLCLEIGSNTNNKTVNNVARHLRNVVSHYRFEAFENSKSEISRIKFEDFTDKTKTNKTFEATIPVANLRKFLNTFSDKMIKIMKRG